MTNNPYAPLPSVVEPVESVESSLPVYSRESHPNDSLSLDDETSNSVTYLSLDLSRKPSNRRFGAFTIVWPSPSKQTRTVMCEWGLTKEQTAENLRLAVPEILSKRSTDKMVFQIPVGTTWANVLDSNWDALMIGRTYEEVKVLVLKTKFEKYRDSLLRFWGVIVQFYTIIFLFYFISGKMFE